MKKRRTKHKSLKDRVKPLTPPTALPDAEDHRETFLGRLEYSTESVHDELIEPAWATEKLLDESARVAVQWTDHSEETFVATARAQFRAHLAQFEQELRDIRGESVAPAPEPAAP